eukprot:g17397.t1
MSIKLRDLIRNVRACRTAAEEREVIAKECALCRTAFKGKDDQYRHRNVAKLLYIHMLGYPTHWAQMESLKLIASQGFAEKRIGYLALMLLLDERQKVLMLVTHSMSKDMIHENQYVAGLALCALGNISSSEICSDLAAEVEKLMNSPNPYLRKKAVLCATRCIRKVPELSEDFVETAINLLKDKNHAVLLADCTLIIEMINADQKLLKKFRKCVPQLLLLLKNLVSAGYVSEYDVRGITDPFLQVKIIHLLRLLGQNHSGASEQMNDVLAQVAINTEPTKNPGNAILYEAVMTIMAIEAEGGLRVLAINILGRFLLNRDNNIRYVALNTLCKSLDRDMNAIQRHRTTIVGCLKDPDISIRRRALDLIYALVTEQNVKALVKEMLTYLALTSGDTEFKRDLTDKICSVVTRYSPAPKWKIDRLLMVLQVAGHMAPERVLPDLLHTIGRAKELHPYCAHKLFHLLRNKKRVPHHALRQVCLYTVGEYGQYLISPEGAAAAKVTPKLDFAVVEESRVIDAVERAISGSHPSHEALKYGLNALAKLAAKMGPDQAKRARKLVKTFRQNIDLEVQQRATEYSALMGKPLNKNLKAVLSNIPVPKRRPGQAAADAKKAAAKAMEGGEASDKPEGPPEEDEGEEEEEEEEREWAKERKQATSQDGGKEDEEEEEEEEEEIVPVKKGKKEKEKEKEKEKAKQKKKGGLDSLDDMFGQDLPASSSPTPTASKPASSKPAEEFDILSGLFSPAKAPSAAPARTLSSSASTSSRNPMDLFGPSEPVASKPSRSPPSPAGLDLFSQPPQPPAAPANPPGVSVFQAQGVQVYFEAPNPAPAECVITAHYVNHTGDPLTDFDFQVAVPKFLKLTLQPPSARTLPPHSSGQVTQRITINNSKHGSKQIHIKFLVLFKARGTAHKEEGSCKFP